MPKVKHLCAACGYDGLRSPQRSESGGASHEICPACGFEPGYTDDDQNISPAQWKKQWQKDGSKWFSKGIPQPSTWPPAKKKSAVKRSAGRKPSARKRSAGK